MAQNVIVPTIDLTAAAEGSSVPEYLRNALSFDSMTAFSGNATVANTAGFWRIFGVATTIVQSAGPFIYARFSMTDGIASKVIWSLTQYTGTAFQGSAGVPFDFVVYLNSGESISSQVSGPSTNIAGSTRQIADVNGVLVNPAGFTPQ